MTEPEYDLTKMAELGERYERMRKDTEAVRRELMAEVQKAQDADVPLATIVRVSRVSRERFRQKRKAAERKATED